MMPKDDFSRPENAELIVLLEALCEGELRSDQLKQLEQLVRASDNARQLYLRYVGLHARLELHASLSHSDNPVAESLPTAQFAPSERAIAKLPQSKAQGHQQETTSPKTVGGPPIAEPEPRTFGFGFDSTALFFVGYLIVLGGLILGVYASKGYSPAAISQRTANLSTSTDTIATLRATAGARWQGTALPTQQGSRLGTGSLYLSSGRAEIAFDSGATVVLEGPAWLQLQSADAAFLHSGKLLARVPPKAVGFTVHTPTAEVVDFGTEFGVVVGVLDDELDSAKTDVHVFEGEVDLKPQGREAARSSKQRLTAGRAARLEIVEGRPPLLLAPKSMTADSSRFARLGRSVALAHATATFSQTDFPITNVLAPNTKGWAISRDDHIPSETAVFETVHDLHSPGGLWLTFTLDHMDPRTIVHQLGRFRLSATTDKRSKFADGKIDGGDVTAHWTVLDPVQFVSRGGATLTELEDHSVLATGANPSNDTYTVTVHTMLQGITGFRIEVLEDSRLPDQGPGRSHAGNFVLTHFSVMAFPEAGP